MSSLNDLKINLNGQHTFFLNQDVISEYSGSLRRTIKQCKKKRNKKKKSPEIITIEIDDFPGGPDGFELVSRFCYNNGEISIDVSNVSTLYCCSVYLGMTEKFCFSNLFLQTEKFLEEVFYGSWTDIVSCLKNCEQVFPYADSYGLVDKLILAALTKISRNSDEFSSSSLSSFASSQSPETTKNTPESDRRYVSFGRSNEWWFEDMSSLSPQIILKLIMIIGAYKTNIKNLVLTRFLLHYFKTKLQTTSRTSTELMRNKLEYSELADTAVKGVVLAGKAAFSCRKLFWVLRVLSSFSLSRESRIGLETLIGEMLEQAKLDDLLISAGGSRESGFYNVDLVIRLLKMFVMNREKESREKNMNEMGKLIDKYLREISPDQNLKVSKFLGVAESLPDSDRDSYDGVYRAIDIYLQSHPNLTPQDRTKICRCLNYKKLTTETCKQLARNPKIPPEIAIEALKTRCENQEHTTSHVKVGSNSFSCRYSEETKKPVLLHLEISEKLAERLKTSRGYNRRVMDSFREGL